MNKKKREKLGLAESYLSEAERIVELVRDMEQDSLDNLPENLEGSERYDAMEEAIDALEDALDNIKEARENIDKAQE